jgi:hypothetical protein
MNHYSKERKEETLKYLLPPHNLTVAEISEMLGSGLESWCASKAGIE